MQPSEEYVIMAPCKDEENYICEWIKYHLDLGFDKIYLYDNNDDSSILPKVLYYNLDKSYIDKVIIYPIPGLKAFKKQICFDFLNEKEFKWCAVIDCDEFITLTSHKNIKDYINSFPSDCEQILLPWLFYDPGDFKGDIPIPLLEREYFPYVPVEKPPIGGYGKSIQKKTDKEKKEDIFHWNFNNNVVSYFSNYKKINFNTTQLHSYLSSIRKMKFIKLHNINNCYIKHFQSRNKFEYIKKNERGCDLLKTNNHYNNLQNFKSNYLEQDQLKLSKYEFPNGTLKDEFIKLKGKKILITKENLLPYVLKEGFNITYSGDLTNLNQWINISAHNKCNFNWVDKKFFDNVYKESDFDFIY